MKTVIVDSRISEKMERRLRILGFEPILLPPFAALGEAVRSHPDTLIFKLGDTIVTTADYCEEASYIFSDIRERYPHIKIKVSSSELGAEYPRDCALNALGCGDYVFCRVGSICRTVAELAEREGLRLVDVKQGYPACSAISLGKSIITADEGLIRAAKSVGLGAYRIEAGHISLPPHKYGFIGGASGIFGDRMYFFGDYKLHPSADIIEAAAAEQGLIPTSLSDEPLSDLGGMIFL